MKDKRVVFMGTPEFSVPVLKSLIEYTNVVLVVTKKDSLVGRKHILTPSPIKVVANENNIPVLTPTSLKKEYESILSYKPDIIITCAYGLIIPKEILDFPLYGCINVHASILPKYRGASPISKAIYDGEKETGITIMYMDENIDTGDIISSRSIPIENDDNLESLTNKLSVLGSNLLIETIPRIFMKNNERIKQDDSLASYVSMLTKEDEKLDFNKKTIDIHNHIRSMSPNPGVYIIIDNEIIKLLESRVKLQTINEEVGVIKEVGKDYFGITCKDGIIEITKIKKSGKNAIYVKDYFNGYDKCKLIGKKVIYEK